MCKLWKAIYGLQQSPRAYLRRLRDFLVSIHFKESISDQSLFVFFENNIIAYFLVYIDDIILTSSSDNFVSMVIVKLGEEFALKDLGPLSFFLGIHITTLDNGDILISQQQYLAMLLENLGLQNLKPTDTPMEGKIRFPASDLLDNDGQHRYRQTVWSLHYLTMTRPDISFSVNKMSQYMTRETVGH